LQFVIYIELEQLLKRYRSYRPWCEWALMLSLNCYVFRYHVSLKYWAGGNCGGEGQSGVKTCIN